MSAQKIIKELKTYKNHKNIAGMQRFEIKGNNILGGPNVPTLRKMARDIKKEAGDSRHHIALDLFLIAYMIRI